MKHVVVKAWNRHTRSDRFRSVIDALNCYGKTKVEYSKGRLYLARLLLGKGHPKPVNEGENWNHVKITYKGKKAIEIFDSDYGMEGQFFDENFTEDEIHEIENAFADAGVSTKKKYWLKMTWVRIIQIFGALLGLMLAIETLFSGGSVLQIFISISFSLCFLILLSRT